MKINNKLQLIHIVSNFSINLLIFLIVSIILINKINAQNDADNDKFCEKVYPYKCLQKDMIQKEPDSDIFTNSTIINLTQFFQGLLIMPCENISPEYSGPQIAECNLIDPKREDLTRESICKKNAQLPAGYQFLSSSFCAGIDTSMITPISINNFTFDNTSINGNESNTTLPFNSETEIVQSPSPTIISKTTQNNCSFTTNSDIAFKSADGKFFLFPASPDNPPASYVDENIKITARFGYSSEYFGGSIDHRGIDFSYVSGTPVVASNFGTVVVAGLDPYTYQYTKKGYGNMVIINHQFEDGTKYQTLYAHMVQTPFVTAGDKVKPGQIIGYVGSTGNSTGAHLHFEVRKCDDFDESGACVNANKILMQVDPYDLIFFGIESFNLNNQKNECQETEPSKLVEYGEVKPSQMSIETMAKIAATSVGNVPANAILAIASEETEFRCAPTWEAWNEGDSTLCDDTLLVTMATKNGLTSYDVRGITQFVSSTFSSLVRNNQNDFDNCVKSMKSELDLKPGDKAYDDGIDEDLRSKYSRTILGHSICVAAIKLRNNGRMTQTEKWDNSTMYKVAWDYYGHGQSAYRRCTGDFERDFKTEAPEQNYCLSVVAKFNGSIAI